MKLAGAAALATLLAAQPLMGGSTITASKAALSTASPLATRAGLNVLERGGNAIDAAVAVAFVLAVVHPQAGNLGGGGFLVYYDAGSRAVWTLDFRETAPGGATRTMYEQAPDDSRTGARASGVPGSVAGLAAAHERFGSMDWSELLAPATQLAAEGIVTDGELTVDLESAQRQRKIDRFPSTASLFYPDGKPLPPGSRLVQLELAATLGRIAAHGAREFYEGETSKKLVDGLRAAGGIIGDRDLRSYAAIWRAPLKLRFRDLEIYTMAAPSGGGFVLGEALNILSGYDLAAAPQNGARTIHLFAEAYRRAYIDRIQHVGDPAMTRIDYRELLSAARATQWRTSIREARATPTATLTAPGQAMPESDHTTHFTIVDAAGNIAAVTTTLNENFGSGFVAPGCGFFMNNEMDDFAATPGKPNRYGLVQGTVNAIEPRKRMVSSMTPTIVMRGGRPLLALGTRGGPTIPTTVLQVILNTTLYGMSLQDAVAAPRFHHQAYPEEVFYERDRADRSTIEGLLAIGHAVAERDSIGDVHAIGFSNGKITAVADPRRGGAAGGI